MIESEIQKGQNISPNLGLLAQLKIELYDSTVLEFPTTASVYLTQAKEAIERCQDIDPGNSYAEEMQRKLSERLVSRNN